MKKHQKFETVTNLLWICFGSMGGLAYYLKGNCWISGIMFLLAILYGYRLVKQHKQEHQK